MFAKVKTACVAGINGVMTDVETYIGNGLPSFEIIGKAEAAVKESRERIRAVLKNCGYDTITRKTTINLYPADTVKKGSHFDLPIAIGVLIASGQLQIGNQAKAFTNERNNLQANGKNKVQANDSFNVLEKTAFFGELSLDGRLKPVRGILPMTECSAIMGIKQVVVPTDNVEEAKLLEGVKVLGFDNLLNVVAFLQSNDESFATDDRKTATSPEIHYEKHMDLSDVKGHEEAKRVMEIAASGGHSLLLIGSPGAGKSMLAKRMGTILPNLSPQEQFEVSKIRSIVGEPLKKGGERPFRMIHHSCTKVAMLGGGKELSPGEITLAHNGILFLDELAEFPSAVLDGLRQPMEDGNIVLSRASGSACYPCDFMLVAAANPCLCGRLLEGKDKCQCTPFQRDNYLHRISGPLMDRIDLRVNVFSMKYDVLAGKSHDTEDDMSSKQVRERVTKCRNLQMLRYESEGINCNAHLQYQMLSKYCVLEKDAEMLLQKVIDNEERSGRYYTRVLKTARTIADMESVRQMDNVGKEQPGEYELFEKKIGLKHIAEAIKYKVSDSVLDMAS